MDRPPGYEDLYGSSSTTSHSQHTSTMTSGASSTRDEKLIIALDFGTTYSGVAYAFTNKPDEIFTVVEWPGSSGTTMLKCPTLIKYEEAGKILWGCEVNRLSSGCIDSLKLLLDLDQSRPSYLPPEDSDAMLAKLGQPATDVTADYIKAILEYAYSKIESKYPSGYLSLVKKQYVLSVPAVWSDKAKDATMRAACKAGISFPQLIKEPEAAALYTLHHMGKKGLNPGDALVLCDAGGGTIDLISYEVLNLEPFELKELTSSTGSLSGSLCINKRFEEWIKSVVGDASYSRLLGTDAYNRATTTFNDIIKPGFRSKNDRVEYVNFPKAKLRNKHDKGLVSDTLAISGEKLYDLFEPVVGDINKLLQEQVNGVRLKRLLSSPSRDTNIRAIFLVGGFGSSLHVKEAVTAAFPDIQVIQPNDAQAAIVRGAVMSQLPSEVRVTINHASKHYGVIAWSKVDPRSGNHYRHDWDDTTGEWKVKTMTWYIHKGDDLHRARKIEFEFCRDFKSHPEPQELHFTHELIECAMDRAPRHPRTGVMTTNVTLLTDLSYVPMSHIRKKTNTVNGKVYKWWRVDYKLVVTVGSGPMMFSCTCSGQEAGKVTTQY